MVTSVWKLRADGRTWNYPSKHRNKNLDAFLHTYCPIMAQIVALAALVQSGDGTG